MKFDLHLITGIFIGVTLGLMHTGLAVYLPLFVIGSVIFVLGYLHEAVRR